MNIEKLYKLLLNNEFILFVGNRSYISPTLNFEDGLLWFVDDEGYYHYLREVNYYTEHTIIVLGDFDSYKIHFFTYNKIF